MNRLIRMILYITAGCLGIGCAALILSFALGGGRQVWEEAGMVKSAADRVHEIADETKRRVVQDAELYEGDYDEGDYDEGIGLLTVDASSIQDLSIELQHGSLEIEESDDNLIQVSMAQEFDGITANCEAGKIIIRDDRPGSSSREDAQVFLEIPEGMRLRNVNIQINAGILSQECGFEADKLTVNADAGEIMLSEVTAGVLSASVGAGTMDIEDGVFDTASLNCGVGTMDMEAAIRGDTEIDCGMGSVDLELADGADSVNYLLRCGAGTIEIGDNTYSGLAKESKLNNGASATFTLNCGMGAISID